MKRLSVFGMLMLVFFACRKDIDESGDNIITDSPPIIIDQYDPEVGIVEGTIYGKVYDENQNPVEDATIKYDGKTFSTDKDGRFFIENQILDREGTFFTVEAEGYFKGSRRLYPKDGSINFAYVQLLALNDIGSFNATAGGEVSDNFGLGITFPPNSIRSANGLYSGQVSVAAKWLDPTANNIGEIMPGSLIGLSSRVEEVALVSYGMMAVELFGDNGENLNIADGSTATLSFPLPQELSNSAPSTIPLWSFEDEQYGIWAEEGVATLQGNKYVGEVSHFSFWNCDAPFPLVFIEGQLLTENGTPISNAQISITTMDGNVSRSGFTDDKGYFAGKMPKGQDLILAVGYLGEDCEFNSINLGSFEEDKDLGSITLQESGAEFTVEGKVVDCNNQPITNGLVKISFGNYSTEYYLNEDNSFSIGVLNCDNATEVSITAVDIDELVEGNPVTLPINSEVVFGTLQACGTTVPEFFTLEIDGQSSTKVTGLGAFFEVPETSDYLFIDLGQDSSGVNQSFNFRITMESGLEATYQRDDVLGITVNGFEPSYSNNPLFSCSGAAGGCDGFNNFEFIITKNEGVGGLLEGEFSGTAPFFTDNSPNIPVDLPFSGEFKLPIKGF